MESRLELFDTFAKNLEAVNGTCYKTDKANLAETIVKIYKDNGIDSTCMLETDLAKTAGLSKALMDNGIQVHSDHIRLNSETDKGGITEVAYGIAELGSLIQASDDIDNRLMAIMPEYYIGIVNGSTIVETYDDMFDKLAELKPFPKYVGFITGPSRTADIECVGTVGVHGPLQMSVVIVTDL
ncbi:LutC/YkgG family protein [Anaerococcus tetradius]|jgi:hypothetical protein|uniref:LutC/YkgG family protein n=1 Tax=Anaerococcus tetradius TaxID=33036 RepID=UPI0023F14841|nr:lactate utilization protein C [Anaerococcus tetradius]